MIAQIFLIRWFAPLVFDAVLIYVLARFLSAVRENQTLNAFDAPEESGAFVIFAQEFTLECRQLYSLI